MLLNDILIKFKDLENEKNKLGMKKFGINIEKGFGVSVSNIRTMAKEIGVDNRLAVELWNSGYNEARILATLIYEPNFIASHILDSWVKDLSSWDVCDQFCLNLVSKTKHAKSKAIKWSKSKKEFIKRAGFVVMAILAVHLDKEDEKFFDSCLTRIEHESIDSRNFVKKSINWALRQLGKRNLKLNKRAIAYAEIIKTKDSKSAKWIANDAIKELKSEKNIERLRKKNKFNVI